MRLSMPSLVPALISVSTAIRKSGCVALFFSGLAATSFPGWWHDTL
jgi:hypothetical protein